MSSAEIMREGEDSLLAAEYVLRLLMPDEERAFERRLTRERGLLDEVLDWTNRLTGMDDEVAEVDPPASAKSALHDRLFGAPEPAVPFWRKLGLWQGVSFASLALAGFLAWQTAQVSVPGATDRGPLFVSEIAAEDQSLRLVAVYDSDAGRLRLNRTAGGAAPGRALELWAIAEGGAPVSLGVLPEAPDAGVILPRSLRPMVACLTLAVSDEPPGGSPTGAPTGAVLAAGQVTEL